MGLVPQGISQLGQRHPNTGYSTAYITVYSTVLSVVYRTLYSLVFITAYIIVYGTHYRRPEEMGVVPQGISQPVTSCHRYSTVYITVYSSVNSTVFSAFMGMFFVNFTV